MCVSEDTIMSSQVSPLAAYSFDELHAMPFFELPKETLLDVVVTYVYDGDTVHGVIHDSVRNTVEKYKIRMMGYDSPEIKPRKNIANRENVIQKANEAKKVLEGLVWASESGQVRVLRLQYHGWDKYGRVLATIYNEDGENLNDYMIANGYGYVYDGGTKQT